MSKIAVSSQGPGLNDQVDPRFGRAAYFVIVDPETMTSEVVDNSAAKTMSGGAGIQAAETVVKAGAKVVLSGFIGPKAFQALRTVGVTMGQDVDGMTVREAVELFKAGKVSIAEQATKPGHWA